MHYSISKYTIQVSLKHEMYPFSLSIMPSLVANLCSFWLIILNKGAIRIIWLRQCPCVPITWLFLFLLHGYPYYSTRLSLLQYKAIPITVHGYAYYSTQLSLLQYMAIPITWLSLLRVYPFTMATPNTVKCFPFLIDVPYCMAMFENMATCKT